MITYYDPNIHFAKHTVRVTLMDWDYVGHIAFEMGGNCRGGDILDPDHFEDMTADDIDRLVENDCQMELDEDEGFFTLVLTRPSDGETLRGEYDDQEIKNIIVGMEIIKHEKEPLYD